jgi:hypothetical protein
MQELPSMETRPLLSRRKLLAAGTLTLVSSIAGCSGSGENEEAAADEDGTGNDEGSDGSEESENEDASDEEEGIEAGESYSFEGNGSDVSDEFELTEGIATIEFSHSGESNFIATMVALEGEDWDDELLVNVIGSIEGRSALAVSGGAYRLDVDADGDWSIDLEQPAVSEGDAESPPIEHSGEGPDYFGPVALDGVHEVTASHDGESNFILQAHGIDGDWDLVVNEIGEFEGSSTLRSSELVYFDVEADGNWSVSVE